jgi:hypothetical protein
MYDHLLKCLDQLTEAILAFIGSLMFAPWGIALLWDARDGGETVGKFLRRRTRRHILFVLRRTKSRRLIGTCVALCIVLPILLSIFAFNDIEVLILQCILIWPICAVVVFFLSYKLGLRPWWAKGIMYWIVVGFLMYERKVWRRRGHLIFSGWWTVTMSFIVFIMAAWQFIKYLYCVKS